ncbi:hypothetical protein BJ170DRAFT_315782 [Xylariales sp. AK1849]|nr:hypothetical protein BJ170DRAFT_315782 [Xylariales sp. AK1849]
MPPRHQTLPQAQTASARAAMASFHCDLCSKGYSRMNDYEAHLSSYDHTHRQRMKDMKQMVKDPTASSRARKAEQKADGLISISLAGGPGEAEGGKGVGGGFKKGGFKKSGFKSAFAPVGDEVEGNEEGAAIIAKDTETEKKVLGIMDESDTEDEGYEVYDPRKPTD